MVPRTRVLSTSASITSMLPPFNEMMLIGLTPNGTDIS